MKDDAKMSAETAATKLKAARAANPKGNLADIGSRQAAA